MALQSVLTMHFFRVLAILTAFIPSSTMAGRYPAVETQTFTFADGTTSLGDGTLIGSNRSKGVTAVWNRRLRLTLSGSINTNSSFKLPDLDPGSSVRSWKARFGLRMRAKAGSPAHGWSLNLGPIPAGNGGGESGFPMNGGLVIAFDTHNDGGNPPGIEVFANGISVGRFPQAFKFDTTTRAFAASWNPSGLDLSYDGKVICTNLATPGHAPAEGHTFAFSARTGKSTQTTLIDDLLITTIPDSPLQTNGPVISEFCADNSGILEDEDGDSNDWIEIYNGSPRPAKLKGWTLTDDETVPEKWRFPAVTIPAYGYLTIQASAKNRSKPDQPLHANFRLAKTGGYLGLTSPKGIVASSFRYGEQAEDVSYGLRAKGRGHRYGFLGIPSPGGENSGPMSEGAPAEKVVFLKSGEPTTGGLFANDFTLSILAPAAKGSKVRYTLDNTTPTENSEVFTGTLSISSTTTVRARVYTPGHLPGPVSSRTFLKLDPSLTNYHASGQPFSSNLPIIVMDSFGIPVDSFNSATQPRPFYLTYAVVIDKNPHAGAPGTNRATITGPADFQGRGGTHVRGETSADFPMRSYSWELWDNDNEDKKASLLGFKEESDWVLHAPYNDKTLMRNFLIHDRMRALDGNAQGMGVKLVEVFYNQDGGALAENDYRGVYVLTEKIKRSPHRVDVEKLNGQMTRPSVINGGYIFKRDKLDAGDVTFTTATNGVTFTFVDPEIPNSAQRSWLENHLNAFETSLAGPGFSDPDSGYPSYINPRSFIDNQWFVEIAKQIDGYRWSTYFFKDRNGRINAGPLWDYNLSLFNANYNGGESHSGWYYSLLGPADYYYWPRLHQDPNYRLQHWDRYWELRRGIFETNSILNRIDSVASQLVDGSVTPVTNYMSKKSPLMENPAMRHFRKWPVLGTYLWPNPNHYGTRRIYWNGPGLIPTDYRYSDAEVDAMKSFLKLRLEWIDDQNHVGTTIYRPPVFSPAGGHVTAGTPLTISPHTGTAPSGFSYAAGGTVYYTLDESDPRGSDGNPAGIPYLSPLAINRSVTIRARLYQDGNWSPVNIASFVLATNQTAAAPDARASAAINSSPQADSDGDGLVDLIEYACGSDANNPASAFQPVAGEITVGSGAGATRHLTLSFRRSITAEDVVCVAEASDSLGPWSSSEDAVKWVSSTNNGDGTLTCTWRCVAPIDGRRQFMRLKVTKH